jgi:peptide/nickel transport system permease protein
MSQYIIRRIILAIPVIIGVTFVAYAMLLLTGDPTGALAGEHASEELRAAIRERYGLDDPIYIQYGRFLTQIFQGELGTSIMTKTPVMTELKQFLPATIELALAAMTIAVIVGIPLGVIAAYRHNSFIDLWVFGLKLGWFPTTGRIDPSVELNTITNLYVVDSILTLNFPALVSSLHHLALPAIALATIPTAFIARITRSSMLDVLNAEYVRTARAKGVMEFTVVNRHALKNAMLPVITVIGLQTGFLLAGAILTETIFAWPGMGRWVTNAIVARNFPVVQAGVFVFALIFVFVNIVVDISYAWFDPRIRYQ